MADFEMNPFGEHESRADESISLDSVTTGGRSTWELEHE